ncbi:MAG TPA: taurine dioxygenase [Balneolaceae bacterium]|nr:taurine dioxygenase [Balneolaceae bacterium]
MAYRLIDPKKIKNMLFNDAEYIIEFCEAGIQTFEEFARNYQIHLLNRDMENLRKAGHKMKPGAQMMGAGQVVDEYEYAKKLLEAGADNESLAASVKEMDKVCTGAQKELEQLAEEQK